MTWTDKHSINCRGCDRLVDERDCVPAPGDDGGALCLDCQQKED